MFTKRLFALATLLFLCSIAFAQQVTMGSRTSHLKLGFNMGGAWQQSDIRSNLGAGIGTTLEFAIIENEYSVFGMSLRGRYLYSDIKGKDLKASTGFRNNPALTGQYNGATNYSSQASIFQNFHSRIDQLDLELMITLNRLRRHGILLYGFGGAGFTGYRVNTDQLDANGNTYDYSKITGTSESEVKSQLDAMRDKNYETHAENKGRPDWAFAPSWGAGIGFYLSPYVVLGFEHKVTHPVTDLLDGQQWYNNNERTRRNDVYHYTTLFFRFDLFGGKYRGDRTRTTDPVKPDYNNYTAAPLKPEIYVNNPVQNPYNGCYADIQLTIKNIESKANITVRQDGALIDPSLYDFSSVSGMFTYRTNLLSNATFAVTAENSAGSKTSYLSFTCTKNDFTPVQPVPLVRITAPSTNPFNSTNCNQIVMATIDNIQGKNYIEVRKDGNVVSSNLYDFNSSTRIFTMNTTLVGSSTFTIKAINSYGSDTKSVTMSCAAPTPRVFKPIIIVSSPASNPYTTPNCVADIFATIHNIESKNNIEVRQNGATISSVNYSYDPHSKRFTLNTPISGITVFTIVAANNGGTETATLTIKCEPVINPTPVIPKPVITIVQPTDNPHISANCKSGINAVIVNVEGKQNLEVRKDGQILSSGLYNYDPNSKAFSLNMDIKEITTFTITAVNVSGKESASVTVKCEPKTNVPVIAKPVITVIKPANDPYITADCKTGISAVIVNVDGKQNLEVRENGQIISSSLYSYDTYTKLFTLNKDVKEITTYTITAANAAGKETATLTIKCEPKQNDLPVLPKPIISVVSPVDNPHISHDCKSAISAAILNIQGKQNIEVRQNGQIVSSSSYNYDVNSKIFTLNTDIKEITIFTITAANASGKETATLSIKCEPKIEEKPVLPKPVITVTNPLDNPHVATDCKAGIKANILFIDGKQNIEVRQNGQIISSSLYSYDALTKTMALNVDIKEITSYTITAANASGKESAVITIKCEPKQEEKPALPKPVITVISPGSNPYLAPDCKVNLKATILNVDSKQSIEVRQNGQIVSSNLYSYDAATRVLTLSSEVKAMTAYTISAINPSGKVSEVITIDCEIKEEEKITICHLPPGNTGNPQTISIPVSALKAHLDHGDLIGTCEEVEKKKKEAEEKEEKVTICHLPPGNTGNPQTLTIPKSALKAHLDHGDVLGTCDEVERKKKEEEEKKKKEAEEKEEKVTICHLPPGNTGNPQTLTIPKSALKAHLDHGDVLGTCDEVERKKKEDEEKKKKEAEEKNKPKVDFDINNGKVVPRQCYNASVTVVGCALKEGGVGMDYPVIVQVKFGSSTVDPFGTYSGYNKTSDVNDHKQHTWNSSLPIAPNTAISVKAKSYNPKNGSLLYERNSSTNDPFVRVLRNGDAVPKVAGFAGQADAETYLKGYIVDGKMNLQANQAIYLFELGTNSTTSTSNDLQDCVILVTLSPAVCSGPNLEDQLKREEEKQKQLEADKLKREQEEREKKANEERLKKEAEDKAKKEQEERLKKEAEEKARKEAEDNEKIIICHIPPGNPDNPQTISIPKSALKAHLDHGDIIGSCEDREEKITICHMPPGNPGNGQTLSIPKSALKAHLDHGDVIGTCDELELKKKKEDEERIKKENEEKLKKEVEEKLRKEKEELERIKKEQEDKLKKELEDKTKRDEEERLKKEAEEKAKKEAEANEEKVTICHMPPGNTGNAHTLSVPKSALKAHLDHGDVIGTCEELDLKKKKEAEEERIKKEHDEKIKHEVEEKLRKDLEERERIKRENEEKLKKEQEDKTKHDEQERLNREAAEKAKHDEQERLNREAAEKAKHDEQERLNRETAEKAKHDEQERLNREAAEKAKHDEQERLNREVAEKAKHDEQERLNREAAEKAKRDEQERLHREAVEKAKREELERQQHEAAEKAKREEQERLHREAEEKAKREAAEKAKHEEEERMKREAEEREKQNNMKKDGE